MRTLANCYDPDRFNPAIRSAQACGQRKRLGFDRKDMVFAFVSQGHYERKGFWRAVAALSLLRGKEKGASLHVRFLVIGGKSATLCRLGQELDRRQKGWRKWISFTGNVSSPEKALSAAAAFLFPSAYEGFSLAEIEAAAPGLPLLLTGHGGTEMILRNGQNGLLLADDPVVMADQLADYLEGRSALGAFDRHCRVAKNFRANTGAVLTPEGYAARVAAFFAEREAARAAPFGRESPDKA